MPGQTKPQTPPSFIPRDTGQQNYVRHSGGSGLIDLLALLAVVLFVASGALAAAVFLYHQYLSASGTSKIEQLNRASAAFEPALIHELARLDDRMRVGGEILATHIAPSAFFKMLEATTVQTITFRSLTFDAADAQRMTIHMDGVADSTNAIALQADVFSKVGMVTSPIFSNIDRRADGVHFSFSALLDPSTLNFAALVRGVTGGSSPTTPSSPIQQIQQQQQQVSPFNGTTTTTTPEAGAAELPVEGE